MKKLNKIVLTKLEGEKLPKNQLSLLMGGRDGITCNGSEWGCGLCYSDHINCGQECYFTGVQAHYCDC